MSRRRYLVAYDIADPKRWRQVYDVVRCYGDRMQYSVYLCDLDEVERIKLLSALRTVINHRLDRVAIVDLGDPSGKRAAAIEFMGSALPLPDLGPQII
jgi:CRISPR-associated protein Cas2